MLPVTTMNKKYYNEIFMEKCLLTKLLTFLEDKERCHAAGYTYYTNYRHGSGIFLHQTITIGYDNPEKENITADITYTNDNHLLYWVHVTCIGPRFLKYMRSIIETYCQGKETFAMRTVMRLSKAECVLASARIICNKVLNKAKDGFMLEVLNNMHMTTEEARLFPLVETDGVYDLKRFTLENLNITNKVFDAIIEGITHHI